MTKGTKWSKPPQIHLVGKTELDRKALSLYLQDIGAEAYNATMQERGVEAALSDGAELIMAGGKLCYRSWEPGLNPNVTMVREDPAEYIGNIISSQHGSVLEHVSYSFVLDGVSRVFTHEVVRHRHPAISQESLRYVRLTEDFKIWLPPSLDPVREEAVKLIDQMQEFQKIAAEKMGMDDSMPFSEKKKLTSALRRLAPIGLSTAMLWTANLRSLRHIILMRTSPHAEEEVRFVYREIGHMMKEREPEVFQDFSLLQTEEDPEGAWVSAAGSI